MPYGENDDIIHIDSGTGRLCCFVVIRKLDHV